MVGACISWAGDRGEWVLDPGKEMLVLLVKVKAWPQC